MYTKELLERKNDLITRAQGVLDKAKQEKRELTDDEAKQLSEIRDSIKKIAETLKLKEDIDEAASGKKPSPAADDPDDVEDSKETDDKEKKEEQQQVRAFDDYLRGKLNKRAATNLTNKDSNTYVIPSAVANKIITKVYDISPILERSTKYNVKGNIYIPYYDETKTAITVAYSEEFTSLSSSVGNFDTIDLTGYLAGALTLVSRSLVNNVNFDLVNFVIEQMAISIARFIENELINGTKNKVTGLSTLKNTLTAAAADKITSDELIELQGKVKDVYQKDGMWVISPAVRTAIRKLKDSNGRYLLQDDINSPFGQSLLGKPVYVSDNMPEAAAGARSVIYGDFSGLATKFSEDINIEVLRERYADMHAIGVIGWLEFDSKVENAQKLAALVMAAA